MSEKWKAVKIGNSWDVTNDAGDPSKEYSVLECVTEESAKLFAAAPETATELAALRAWRDEVMAGETESEREGLTLEQLHEMLKASE